MNALFFDHAMLCLVTADMVGSCIDLTGCLREGPELRHSLEMPEGIEAKEQVEKPNSGSL